MNKYDLIIPYKYRNIRAKKRPYAGARMAIVQQMSYHRIHCKAWSRDYSNTFGVLLVLENDSAVTPLLDNLRWQFCEETKLLLKLADIVAINTRKYGHNLPKLYALAAELLGFEVKEFPTDTTEDVAGWLAGCYTPKFYKERINAK